MGLNDAFVKSVEQATLKQIETVVKNMDLACVCVEGEAKKNCPVDNGILRASIKRSVSLTTTEITGTIGTNLLIGLYVHQGTGIYAVKGDGRKTPWNWGNKGSKKWPGRKGFRGARPNPFLDKAKISKKSSVEKILAKGDKI